jgi:hypothetical protein
MAVFSRSCGWLLRVADKRLAGTYLDEIAASGEQGGSEAGQHRTNWSALFTPDYTMLVLFVK